MRVLIVYPKFYVYGGAELLIVRLCNYLTSKGIKNSLLTSSILPEIQSDLKGTDVIKVENKASNIVGKLLALQRGVGNCLDDFDVINVHNFPAELSIFPYRRPAVWMCNEPELHINLQLSNLSFRSRLFLRTLLPFERFVVRNYIKHVVVADEFNANRFKKLYAITPDIIHYGIDHEFFSQGDAKEAKSRLGLSDNFVILHVGMLTPFKNQIASIRAVDEIKGKIPHTKLILAGFGEGEYKKNLEEYIRHKNLRENVSFAGHLSRHTMRDLFYACDVVLHPVKSQGGWLSAFEAICAGKPVVVSEEMTASYIIRREEIGVVTNHYTEAIRDIYINRDNYRDMVNRGQRWVKEHLNWDKFGDEMVKVFNKALVDKC
jgi:glycosyltransferase involved in cell wall biosynthesis